LVGPVWGGYSSSPLARASLRDARSSISASAASSSGHPSSIQSSMNWMSEVETGWPPHGRRGNCEPSNGNSPFSPFPRRLPVRDTAVSAIRCRWRKPRSRHLADGSRSCSLSASCWQVHLPTPMIDRCRHRPVPGRSCEFHRLLLQEIWKEAIPRIFHIPDSSAVRRLQLRLGFVLHVDNASGLTVLVICC
jgi:hypothetical protein